MLTVISSVHIYRTHCQQLTSPHTHFPIPFKPIPLTTFHYRFCHAFPTHLFSVLHELESSCKCLATHLPILHSHHPQSISHGLTTWPNPSCQPSPPMPKIRLPHEDSDIPQAKAPTNADLVSDDYRSMAAASWSIKREHESTLDDGQRHAELPTPQTFLPPETSVTFLIIVLTRMNGILKW